MGYPDRRPWSDLDLLAVVADDPIDSDRATAWLPDLGVIFSSQQEADQRGLLSRMAYADGLWLDLITVTADSLTRIQSWDGIPFDRRPTALIDCPASLRELVLNAQPTERHASVDQGERAIQKAKFLAILALKKHVRREDLVARHLALGLWQEVLVLHMLAAEMGDSARLDFAPSATVGWSVPQIVADAVRACDQIAAHLVTNHQPMEPVIDAFREAALTGA